MAADNNPMPFPTEVLSDIFKWCDVRTLGRLSSTCKTFRNVISADYMWKEKCKGVLASNCENEEFSRKTRPVISCRDKCRISSRWKNNITEKKVLIKCRKLMVLNLELEADALYCSNGSNIEQYSRAADGCIVPRLSLTKKVHSSDISQFVINGDEIISAGRDGTITRHDKKTFEVIGGYEIYQPKAARDIECVAAGQDIIACGSRDANIRVFRTKERHTELESEIYTGTKVLSLAIMPFTKTLVAGLPALRGVHPLKIYDLETFQFLYDLGEYVKGAGILSLKPETAHTFLSGGYDTTIRMWDIRTPQRCVSMWMEPFDNSIYCVKSDNNRTIVSGACRHALLHLWDKRCRNVIHMHFIRGYRSSVHSVAFDACRKIVALDTAVLEFNYNV